MCVSCVCRITSDAALYSLDVVGDSYATGWSVMPARNMVRIVFQNVWSSNFCGAGYTLVLEKWYNKDADKKDR